jgi:acyl-coenzyme A thioesterase PaaI-like protein
MAPNNTPETQTQPDPGTDYLLYHPARGKAAAMLDGDDGAIRSRLDPLLPAEDKASARGLPFPLPPDEIRAWEDRLNRLPIVARLGARIDLSDPRATQVHIDEVMPYHLGGLGVSAFNGSIISGILDCAVGAAGVVHFSGSRAGTLSLTLNFLRPLFGRRATARCVVTRRTGNVLFMDAWVLDERNRICSSAAGIAARVAVPGRPREISRK